MPMAKPRAGAAWMIHRAPALIRSPASARVPANPRDNAAPARMARSTRIGAGAPCELGSPRVWVTQAGSSSANPHGLTGATIPATRQG